MSTLLDTAVASGANNVRGIDFRVSDPVAVERDARRLAVADARGKVADLASAGGLSIKRVLMISDGRRSNSPSVHRDFAAYEDFNPQYATPIEAGQLEVTVEVEMVCEIAEQTS